MSITLGITAQHSLNIYKSKIQIHKILEEATDHFLCRFRPVKHVKRKWVQHMTSKFKHDKKRYNSVNITVF